jgi:hypothetical protein
MDPDQKAFLALRTFPARLTAQQTAWYLGFEQSQIATLVAAKLLKPLGHPPRTGSKYFAYTSVAELRDAAWLAKASDAIVKFWGDKNASRRNGNHPVLNSAA